MKKILLIGLIVPFVSIGQNTFPASGNVGIGTTTGLPNKLVVDGVDNFNEGIMLRNTTSYQHLITGYADGNNPTTGSALQFRVANNSIGGHAAIMTLRGNGRVGIGTTNPLYLIHAEQSQDAGTGIVIKNMQSSSSASAGFTAFAQNQNVGFSATSDGFSRPYPGFHTSAALIIGSASNGLNIISNNGSGAPGTNTGKIRFITYANAGGVTSNTSGNDALTRMVIDANGNVGIGTITPAVPLEVSGSFYLNRPASMIDGGNTIGGDIVNIVPSTYSAANTGYVSFTFPSPTAFKIVTDFDGHNGATGNYRDISFGRRNSGDYLMIKDGGNIGIGTSTPSEKLSVNGTVKAKKVVVNSAWSDYVFDDDYKLRTLTSLESYIKTNKHLPEVPTAKEVEEKGVSVGDNQALLLKKIEELTLYIIEMNKKVATLEKKLADK